MVSPDLSAQTCPAKTLSCVDAQQPPVKSPAAVDWLVWVGSCRLGVDECLDSFGEFGFFEAADVDFDGAVVVHKRERRLVKDVEG